MPRHLLPGRRIATASEARALLAQVDASGQPLKPWCRTNDINVGSLTWWRVKLHRAEVADHRRGVPEEVRIAEVSVPRPTDATPTRYELELPNRVFIRLDGHFDATVLERLLAVVARC